MDIHINRIGKILKGTHAGWYILIVPYEPQPTSYIIFVTNHGDFGRDNDKPLKDVPVKEGYDTFITNYESVLAQAEYENWEIEWMEE